MGFPDFPPLNYINESGEVTGSTVNKVRAAVELSGYTFSGKILPVRRAFVSMKRGDFDILSCMGKASYQDLGNSVNYSDTIVGYIHLNAYHLNTTPYISAKNGLLGYGVVIRRGYRYAGMLNWLTAEENYLPIQIVNNAKQGLRLIIAERKDYFLEYKSAVEMASEKIDISMLNSSRLSSAPHYLVFSKTKMTLKMQMEIERSIRLITSIEQ